MLNDNFVTFEIGKAKHIALVAHDGKKKELIEVLENYDQEQSMRYRYNRTSDRREDRASGKGI